LKDLAGTGPAAAAVAAAAGLIYNVQSVPTIAAGDQKGSGVGSVICYTHNGASKSMAKAVAIDTLS
jgi:hypothetical protein